MKIAVIAANGRTGQAFVHAALAAGHNVRAGTHGPSSFTPHPQLQVTDCDATKPDDVEWLITGQDAVVSFIGHTKHSSPTVQTDAIKVLVDVMKRQDITRIVSLTGTGARLPEDTIPLLDHFSTLLIRLINPKRVDDGKNHLAVLQESGLEWTVLRVMKLENVAAKPFTLTPHGPTKYYVGREEVAQAALQVLERHSFVGEAPIISPVV